MFGLSFGELVVVLIMAVVVIGPKDMPKVLRKLGQWAGQLRRMAANLRAQSGIDDVLRTEGLTEDLNEIRKLARGELDAVSRAARLAEPATYTQPRQISAYDESAATIEREREHPKDGPDVANAMPDTAFVYVEGFPKSKWGADPCWLTGEDAPVAPAEPPPTSANGPAPASPPAEPS